MKRRPTPSRAGRSGLTLIEVLLAATLLGIGLLALSHGLSSCLAIFRDSRVYQQAQWVVGLGELAHPIWAAEEIDDLTVDDDGDLAEGFTFSREVDEKEDPPEGVEDDGLYVVHTRVRWGSGGPAQSEDLASYVYRPEEANK